MPTVTARGFESPRLHYSAHLRQHAYRRKCLHLWRFRVFHHRRHFSCGSPRRALQTHAVIHLDAGPRLAVAPQHPEECQRTDPMPPRSCSILPCWKGVETTRTCGDLASGTAHGETTGEKGPSGNTPGPTGFRPASCWGCCSCCCSSAR